MTTVTAIDRSDAFGGRYLPEILILALETSHAGAWVPDTASCWELAATVLIDVGGRGDKDVGQVSAMGVLASA